MERKKRILIFSVCLSIIMLMVVLSATIFRLKTVSVEGLLTSFYLTNEDNDAIIEAGEFDYGKNIFFLKFDDNIKRIEQKFPYVKVENIERKFPNYAVINIVERKPAVRLVCDYGFYVVDEDLKVLNVVQNPEQYNETLKESATPVFYINGIEGLKYNRSATAGDFLGGDLLREYVSAFYNGAVITDTRNGKDVAVSCISDIEDITINHRESGDYFLVNFVGTSTTAEIAITENLTESIYKILAIYIQNGSDFSVYKCLGNGNIVAER